jgi:hypothetical protein
LPSTTDAGIWHTGEGILHEAAFVFSNLSDSLFFCNLKKLDFDLLTTDIIHPDSLAFEFQLSGGERKHSTINSKQLQVAGTARPGRTN